MAKKSVQTIVCLLLLLPAFLLAQKAEVIPADAIAVADRFDTNRMRADLEFLSSDLLEGRGTGTI